MTQQDFNQEQNPYEYEKPVSSSRIRKYGSFAAFGFLALGTAFGGNALASSLTATGASPNAVIQVEAIDPSLSPVSALTSATSNESPIIGVPVLPVLDLGRDDDDDDDDDDHDDDHDDDDDDDDYEDHDNHDD